MLKVRTLLLAEDVVQDTASNTVTLVKLLEQVVAESYPLTLPKVMLYALLDKEEVDLEEQAIHLNFSINDQTKNEADFNVLFKGNSTRLIISLGSLKIAETSRVKFTISTSNQNELSSYGIDFELREHIISAHA